MASWIEHHAHGLLRLVRRHLSADFDRVGDGLVEVVDLNVEVHRHLRLALDGGPHRPRVVRLGLAREVIAGIAGGCDGSSLSVSLKTVQSKRRAYKRASAGPSGASRTTPNHVLVVRSAIGTACRNPTVESPKRSAGQGVYRALASTRDGTLRAVEVVVTANARDGTLLL